MRQESEDVFEGSWMWVLVAYLPQAKFGEVSYIRSSRLWTTQKPVLVSELEAFIGKNVRLDCDDRAGREDVKNI